MMRERLWQVAGRKIEAAVASVALDARASIINEVTGGRGDAEMLWLIGRCGAAFDYHAHVRNAADNANRVPGRAELFTIRTRRERVWKSLCPDC
jgi:dihydropteroate synthase